MLYVHFAVQAMESLDHLALAVLQHIVHNVAQMQMSVQLVQSDMEFQELDVPHVHKLIALNVLPAHQSVQLAQLGMVLLLEIVFHVPVHKLTVYYVNQQMHQSVQLAQSDLEFQELDVPHVYKLIALNVQPARQFAQLARLDMEFQELDVPHVRKLIALNVLPARHFVLCAHLVLPLLLAIVLLVLIYNVLHAYQVLRYARHANQDFPFLQIDVL